MDCDLTGCTISNSSGIVVCARHRWRTDTKKPDECLVSCQSGLLFWLSFGLHDVSTLSISPTTVEQFRRKGSTQLGAEPFGVGRFAYLFARTLQQTTSHGYPESRFRWRHSINNSWSCPKSPSGQLIVAPHHGRVTSIDIVSRLRPVTLQTCCLHSTCRILFEQCSLCCRLVR